MKIAEFLKRENIFEFALVPFEVLRVTDQRRLSHAGFEPRSAVVFLMPYYTMCEKSNISRYAHCRDYHLFIKELIERAKDSLNVEFACFSDTSPIDEVGAALVSGLGFVGRNGLIINQRYGSYVFIGEFLFPLDSTHEFFKEIPQRNKGQKCLECGACEKACATGGIHNKNNCVSFINQKKKIDETDTEIIKKSQMAWGCDACQEVCPMNQGEETPIEFFKNHRVNNLNREDFEKMIKEGEFEKRAFAWRGEGVLRRNLEILEDGKD